MKFTFMLAYSIVTLTVMWGYIIGLFVLEKYEILEDSIVIGLIATFIVIGLNLLYNYLSNDEG